MVWMSKQGDIQGSLRWSPKIRQDRHYEVQLKTNNLTQEDNEDSHAISTSFMEKFTFMEPNFKLRFPSPHHDQPNNASDFNVDIVLPFHIISWYIFYLKKKKSNGNLCVLCFSTFSFFFFPFLSSWPSFSSSRFKWSSSWSHPKRASIEEIQRKTSRNACSPPLRLLARFRDI